MSGTLTLMLPGNRREVVKTTPATTLETVLAEVCGRPPRPLGNPADWCLMSGKKILDLNTPIRFTGLPSGAKLDVVRTKAASDQPVAAPALPVPASVPVAHSVRVVADSSVSAAPADTAGPEHTAGPIEPHSEAAAAAQQPESPLIAAATKLAGRRVTVYTRQALQAAATASCSVLTSADAQLPEEFYEFTPEDYAAVTAKRKEEEVLMTRAMREAAMAKRASEFTRALIRVEFVDGVVLEAAFGPMEPCDALRRLLTTCVDPSLASRFYLFTAPPKRKFTDWEQSFYMAGFVPAARIHFGVDSKGCHSGPYLRPELMAIVDLVSPHLPGSDQVPVIGTSGNGAGIALSDGAGPSTAQDTHPREGVRSPEELRQTLAAGKKPKWLKL